MKIGYGITAFQKTKEPRGTDGIGEYTLKLGKEIKALSCCEIHPVSFINDETDNQLGNSHYIGQHKTQLMKSLTTGLAFDNQHQLTNKIDIFHATDHYIPKFRNFPVVATIHDVIPLTNPDWFSRTQRIYHQLLKRSMKWADHIITVSDFSKSEICKELCVSPDKISVVYNGYDKIWEQVDSKSQIKSIFEKYSISTPYIIFVGTIQRRKNLKTLVEAIELLPNDIKNTFKLIVVGNQSVRDKVEIENLKKFVNTQKIQWLKWVPTPHLKTLVKQATCLVFPSLAEGFGLPIIEAFAAGTPVVAAQNTSIPEITKNAALLFPGENPSILSKNLENLLTDKGLQKQLIIKGKKRAKDFSWEKAAIQTKDIYRNTLLKY